MRFILAATIWGTSFLRIKIGVQELGPFTLLLLRVSFALLATFIFVFWKRLAIPRSVLWLLPVLGLLNVAVPFVLISWAAVVWLGVLGSCIASMLYLTLTQDVGPTRAVLTTYLFPSSGQHEAPSFYTNNRAGNCGLAQSSS